MTHKALRKAVRHFGSISALARELSIHRQNVQNWLKEKDALGFANVPMFHALKIENLTQGKIKAKELISIRIRKYLK